jgi:hypothetical protein
MISERVVPLYVIKYKCIRNIKQNGNEPSRGLISCSQLEAQIQNKTRILIYPIRRDLNVPLVRAFAPLETQRYRLKPTKIPNTTVTKTPKKALMNAAVLRAGGNIPVVKADCMLKYRRKPSSIMSDVMSSDNEPMK